MLRQIRFIGFKCHKSLQINLKNVNILTGPNNSGKSTVIDAFRILSGATKTLENRRPAILSLPGGGVITGYEIPRGSVPIDLRHVTHEYDDTPAQIEFTLRNGNSLKIHISNDSNPIVEIDSSLHGATVNAFKTAYPISLTVVPNLGPFEQNEPMLADKTVADGVGTRLSHRHFRNYWYRASQERFSSFKTLLEVTWPGVSLSPPEAVGYGEDRHVEMYFSEGRIDREISWSGIGLQIWMQILTYIHKAQSGCFIIDEPDIYLHPDMQKSLVNLLREKFTQCVLSTHSPEIIGDAGLDEVVSVVKGRNRVKRANDIAGLQEALVAVGSSENIELTKLARARRIVFFEGNDRKILKAFGRRFGFGQFVDDDETLFLKLGGFSKASRIESVSWTFSEILRSEVRLFGLFDRDYRCEEELDDFISQVRSVGAVCEVWPVKELENFLLDPDAIAGAMKEKQRAAGKEVTSSELQKIADFLSEEVLSRKLDIFSQMTAFRRRYLRTVRKDHRDEATIDLETTRGLEALWADKRKRVGLAPGKEVLGAVQQKLQREFGRSLTPNEIIQKMDSSSHVQELLRVLSKLDGFCS